MTRVIAGTIFLVLAASLSATAAPVITQVRQRYLTTGRPTDAGHAARQHAFSVCTAAGLTKLSRPRCIPAGTAQPTAYLAGRSLTKATQTRHLCRRSSQDLLTRSRTRSMDSLEPQTRQQPRPSNSEAAGKTKSPCMGYAMLHFHICLHAAMPESRW